METWLAGLDADDEELGDTWSDEEEWPDEEPSDPFEGSPFELWPSDEED